MQTSVEQDRLILLGSYAIIDRTDANAICSLCSPEHKQDKTQTPQAHTEKRGCKPRLRKPAAEAHTEKRGDKPRLRKPAAEAHTEKRGDKPRLRKPAASVLIN